MHERRSCGTCPACVVLDAPGIHTPETMARVMSKEESFFSANGRCTAELLQQNYGNTFTGAVMDNLHPAARQKNGHKEKGPGSPLDNRTRSFMSASMGRDFSDVRVHTDREADASARAINARAYTIGPDIFFARDRFRPETFEGRRLLAHELIHVAQTGGAATTSFRATGAAVSSPSEALEREAHQSADAVAIGERVTVAPSPLAGPAKAYRAGAEQTHEEPGWFVRKIAQYANDIPGYTLLSLVIGRDPITGVEVERSARGFLAAFFGLVPGGNALFDRLNEAGVIDRAFEWLADQLRSLGITWERLKGFVSNALEVITEWSSFDTKKEKLLALIKPYLKKVMDFAASIGAAIKDFIFKAILEKLGAPVKKIVSLFNTAGDVVGLIAADPVGFLKNLLAAVKKGFNQFAGNIYTHLKTGVMGWLLGNLEGAGIEVPKTFDLKSIFGLVLQILGITPQFLKKKAARVIGEKNVALLEKAWDFISTLIREGVSGLWAMMKEYLGSLKEMVIGAIREWVVTTIVKSAIAKLVTMFNPVGAIIGAIQTIYNTVMFFIERIKQIAALVDAVFKSMLSIARGVIDKAADWIERTMARTVPVIISFLARLIGLGGIGEKIKTIIKKLQARVDKAIDRVMDAVVKKVKAFVGKIMPGKKEKPMSNEKSKRRDAGLAELEALRKRAMTDPEDDKEIHEHLAAIKTKYGFTRLEPRLVGDEWEVTAVMSPPTKKRIKAETKKLFYRKPFEIPSVKEHKGRWAKHISFYTAKADKNDLFHEKRKRRTGQVSKWKSRVKSKLAKNKLEEAMRPVKKNGLGMSEQDILRPTFNRDGKPTNFHIDHIVEYQLEGVDEPENYWMLRGSENSSSGGIIQSRIARIREQEKFPNGRLVIKKPVITGSADPSIYWKREEVENGKHIEVYRTMKSKKKGGKQAGKAGR